MEAMCCAGSNCEGGVVGVMNAPLRVVERAVGDAEGIPGEEARVRRVHDRVVVQGVAGHVDELERAPAQEHAFPVGDLVHARARDRHELPVVAREGLLAVDLLGGGDEARRVQHVRHAARMQVHGRVGQVAQQLSRAAGVVQVHVGEQEGVDRRARDGQLIKRREQVGHRVVGADVDDRRTRLVHDDVGGGVPGIQVLGVHRGDAVRVLIQARRQGNIPHVRCVLSMYTS